MAENEHKSAKPKLIGGLVGTFRHNLDDRRRLTIPSEWRDAMGMDLSDRDTREYVYVIPNECEDCLDLVPFEEMRSLHDEFAKRDILESDPEAAALWQFAQMLKVDAGGRIRIGDDLLESAGIVGEVVLVGSYRKAQLWAGEKRPPAARLDLAAYRAALAKRKAARGRPPEAEA